MKRWVKRLGIIGVVALAVVLQTGVIPFQNRGVKLLQGGKESSTDTIILSEFVNKEINTLIENSDFKSIAVFLYTSEYKKRYLLASNTEIINAFSNVETDGFFSELLDRNKLNLCTIIETTKLPPDSELYKVLTIKNLTQENYFYMACPLYIPSENVKDSKLIGYTSTVVSREKIGLVSTLYNLRYHTKVIARYLNTLTK